MKTARHTRHTRHPDGSTFNLADARGSRARPSMSRRGFALLALVGGLTVPAMARAAPRSLGVIDVQAGGFDRQHTPVSVQLPTPLAGQQLELQSADGGPVSLDVDASGRGTFIVVRLAPGAKKSYQVTHRGASPPERIGVRVEQDPTGLWMGIGPQRILRYQAVGVAPRPGVGQEFLRGGYIHPVLTPEGRAVTDDYPPEEEHHHGVWTAWTSTSYQGRQPDFWNMGKRLARKDHVAFDGIHAGPVVGGFGARLTSTDLGTTPPTVVLTESFGVVLYRTHPGHAPYHLFELSTVEEVVGNAPLVLPEYRYGGLGVRGAASWSGPEGAAFLTSEGRGRIDGENTRVRWCHLGGLLEGKRAGIAVLVHPGNFRAPQPVRLHPKDPYFSVSPVKAGTLSIEPGRPYASRYRLVVSDGPPDAALLNRLYDDYATPPLAVFKPTTAK